MAGTKQTRRTRPEIRRKNLNIDQTKLDRVRELLGSSSETDAIDTALDMVLFREEVLAGISRIAGKDGVDNVFSGDREP